MRKGLVLAGALVALLAALAAGCGGGGGGSLTKDEYVSKLNAICEEFNNKQDEIGEPQSITEVADKGPRIIDEFDKALDKAKDLKAPDEISDQASRFISLGEQQRDLLNDLVDAAKDNDRAKAQQIGTQISPLDDESDSIANDLGAPACAED